MTTNPRLKQLHTDWAADDPVHQVDVWRKRLRRAGLTEAEAVQMMLRRRQACDPYGALVDAIQTLVRVGLHAAATGQPDFARDILAAARAVEEAATRHLPDIPAAPPLIPAARPQSENGD